MMPAIENCAGIITEEGGLTSHAAVVGLSLGIPVIVGVKEATTLIDMDKKLQWMLKQVLFIKDMQAFYKNNNAKL